MADSEINPAPLVSIIITYYEQDRFIEQTILSAKRQTYKNIEVIIVDDGSPNPVGPVIAHIDGIRVFRKNNEGCPAARNFGFRESGGQFIVFLDQDDLLQPDAVETQMKALNQDDRAVLSFGAARLIGANGDEIRKPHTCRRRKNYLLMLLESNPIECVGGAMIRRRAFIDVGLFDESFAAIGQSDDYDLYLRLAQLGPLVRHTHWVVDYRQHSQNVSRDKERMLAGTMHALDKVERNDNLPGRQRRRISYGRKRWLHTFRPKKDLNYKIRDLYFRFRAMMTVPLSELVRFP
jgi:glycosyltransferase involved in cell wall biosynthesis